MKQYKNRAGVVQWMPSVEELEDMDSHNEGFCLHCGETVPGVEPDARKDKCETCELSKVYGACELAVMGLCY